MNITQYDLQERLKFLNEILNIEFKNLDIVEFKISALIGSISEIENILDILNLKEEKHGNRRDDSRRSKRAVRKSRQRRR